MADRSAPRVVTEADVRQDLGPLLDRVSRKEIRVLIERDGSPVAGIVSIDDVQRLEEAERSREEQFDALSRSWDAFQDVSPEEVEEAVAEAVAAAREQRRRENTASDTIG